MPWRRYSFRDWSKGLFVSPPQDVIPSDALRRAKNVHVLQGRGSVRSRPGSTRRLVTQGWHSPVRYRDERLYGLGAGIVKDQSPGVSILYSGFDGGKLSYAKAPPFIGVQDYLFVANPGRQIKIDPNFATSKWGIDPPDHKAQLSLGAEHSTQIDALDTSSASRTAAFKPIGAAAISYGTPNQEGAGALKIQFDTINQQGVVTYVFGTPQDFTSIGGRESPVEDLIAVWVMTNRPDAIQAFQLKFYTDDQNYYQYDFLTARFDARTRGIGFGAFFIPPGGYPGWPGALYGPPAEQLYKSQGHWPPEQFRKGETFTGVGGNPVAFGLTNQDERLQDQFPLSPNTWVRLMVPKRLFFTTGDPYWQSITKYEIFSRINRRGTGNPENAAVYVDDLRLLGTIGIQGTYRYCFTFKNSTTNHRSNPLFIDRDGNGIVDDIDYDTIEGVVRQTIHIENIPVSTDPQVDKVEIWRTFGNGAAFFKLTELANGTTTYDDEIADSTNEDSRPDAPILQNEEIELTNTVPSSDTFWVTWHQGRAWTLVNTDGKQGRLNYSPIGRPEAVSDFLEITNDADPLQGAVSWNGSLWVFSQSKVWQVTGEDLVVARQITGAPGTLHPFTIAVTPNGIVYFAKDGVRVFDGNTSSLVSHDPMALPFRGLDTDVIGAFVGDVACFGRNEYWVSNGTTTLAVDLTTGTWREIDFAATGLYYEEDQDDFIVTEGTDGNGVFLVDIPGQTEDGGFDLDFDIETALIRSSAEVKGIVRRVYLDIDTGGEDVTATLYADGEAAQTWIVNTSARQTVVYETRTNAKNSSIRLQAALTTGAVEVFGIELDIYHPENTQAG